MKKALPLALFAACAAGLPAFAQDAAPDPAPAPAAPAPAPAAVSGLPDDLAAAARAAVAKGAAWLVSNQRPDGSLSNAKHPGLTGLALWALVGSGSPGSAEACEIAGDWILSKVQPDGGIYQPVPGRAGGGLSTYNTAVCLTALAETKRADAVRAILDARTFLAGAQLTGEDEFSGGFGYASGDGHRYADLNNTAFVMEAMRRSQSFEDSRPAGEKKADLDWGAALAFAERLHNGPGTGDNEGGFAYSPADAKAGTENCKEGEKVVLRSYGSMTYAGLLALVYCELDRDDPRVRSALDWAGKHWSLEENPGVQDQGLYFFYDVIGRTLVAAGVETIPRPEADPVQWRRELAEKVLSLQREDGSWVNSNGRFWENDPVLATAYSLVTLEFVLGDLR